MKQQELEPAWECHGGMELSDATIEALARLLIDLTEPKSSVRQPVREPAQPEFATSA